MILDDLEGPLRTLFQNTCVFGAQHENLNEDRPGCYNLATAVIISNGPLQMEIPGADISASAS